MAVTAAVRQLIEAVKQAGSAHLARRHAEAIAADHVIPFKVVDPERFETEIALVNEATARAIFMLGAGSNGADLPHKCGFRMLDITWMVTSDRTFVPDDTLLFFPRL